MGQPYNRPRRLTKEERGHKSTCPFTDNFSPSCDCDGSLGESPEAVERRQEIIQAMTQSGWTLCKNRYAEIFLCFERVFGEHRIKLARVHSGWSLVWMGGVGLTIIEEGGYGSPELCTIMLLEHMVAYHDMADVFFRAHVESIVVPRIPISEVDERFVEELMATARNAIPLQNALRAELTPTERELQTAALDAMAERDQMSDLLGTSQIDRANLADQVDQLRAEVARLREMEAKAAEVARHRDQLLSDNMAHIYNHERERKARHEESERLRAEVERLREIFYDACGAITLVEGRCPLCELAKELLAEVDQVPPPNPHPSGCHTAAPGSRDCDSDGHESCGSCSRRKESEGDGSESA